MCDYLSKKKPHALDQHKSDFLYFSLDKTPSKIVEPSIIKDLFILFIM